MKMNLKSCYVAAGMAVVLGGCHYIPAKNEPVLDSEQTRFNKLGKIWGKKGIEWNGMPRSVQHINGCLWYGALTVLNPFRVEKIDHNNGLIQAAWYKKDDQKTPINIQVIIQKAVTWSDAVIVTVSSKDAHGKFILNHDMERDIKSQILECAKQKQASQNSSH